ncbi:YmaF family protein [Desulfolucanica intricata]|uniref:YmaF family protein n=1 Tax=Desulfolucanica intricata TaxID=1285191 RepID=UPI0008298D71|nr:YmaF family protein [Desulfolucanica intricata]
MLDKEIKKDKIEKHNDKETQTHVHEFLGSTKLAPEGELRHNHRFAGVTSEAIPKGDSHIHAILVNTDFVFNHLHEVGVETGPAIKVGNGRHVHFVKGITTLNADHIHKFVFATLIEDPLD